MSEDAASLTFNDSSGVLTGDQRLKLAKSIIDTVQSSTLCLPEVIALFFDEMASSAILHEVHSSLNECLITLNKDNFEITLKLYYLRIVYGLTE